MARPKQSVCKRGHALTPQNRAGDGSCKTCNAIRVREHRRGGQSKPSNVAAQCREVHRSVPRCPATVLPAMPRAKRSHYFDAGTCPRDGYALERGVCKFCNQHVERCSQCDFHLSPAVPNGKGWVLPGSIEREKEDAELARLIYDGWVPDYSGDFDERGQWGFENWAPAELLEIDLELRTLERETANVTRATVRDLEALLKIEKLLPNLFQIADKCERAANRTRGDVSTVTWDFNRTISRVKPERGPNWPEKKSTKRRQQTESALAAIPDRENAKKIQNVLEAKEHQGHVDLVPDAYTRRLWFRNEIRARDAIIALLTWKGDPPRSHPINEQRTKLTRAHQLFDRVNALIERAERSGQDPNF